MNGRIDPPSSLNTMGALDLADKAKMEKLIIATHRGELIGCGFVSLRETAIYLGKLAVDPCFRRRGVLRAMMDLADRIAYQNDKQLMELQTRIELRENHETFQALGFESIGTTQHDGYDRPTSLIMQRRVAHSSEPRRPPPEPGHNGGPPLDDPDGHVPPWGKGKIGTFFVWREAYRRAWKVSPAIALLRLKRARACGLTYEEYTSVLLDQGRHIQPSDTDLIAEIMSRR